jgi:hypothetical protein
MRFFYAILSSDIRLLEALGSVKWKNLPADKVFLECQSAYGKRNGVISIPIRFEGYKLSEIVSTYNLEAERCRVDGAKKLKKEKFIQLPLPEKLVDVDRLVQKLVQMDPKILDRLDTVKVGSEQKIVIDRVQSFFEEVEASLESQNQALRELRLQKERAKTMEAEYEERISDDEKSKRERREEVDDLKRQLAKKNSSLENFLNNEKPQYMASCIDLRSKNDALKLELSRLKSESTEVYLNQKDLHDEIDFLKEQVTAKSEECERLQKRVEQPDVRATNLEAKNIDSTIKIKELTKMKERNIDASTASNDEKTSAGDIKLSASMQSNRVQTSKDKERAGYEPDDSSSATPDEAGQINDLRPRRLLQPPPRPNNNPWERSTPKRDMAQSLKTSIRVPSWRTAESLVALGRLYANAIARSKLLPTTARSYEYSSDPSDVNFINFLTQQKQF